MASSPLHDFVLFTLSARIRELAASMKLPVVYGHREAALQGGLAAFPPSVLQRADEVIQ